MTDEQLIQLFRERQAKDQDDLLKEILGLDEVVEARYHGRLCPCNYCTHIRIRIDQKNQHR